MDLQHLSVLGGVIYNQNGHRIHQLGVGVEGSLLLVSRSFISSPSWRQGKVSLALLNFYFSVVCALNCEVFCFCFEVGSFVV